MDMVGAVQSELQQIDTELAEINRRKEDLEIVKSVLVKVLACSGSTMAPAVHVPQKRSIVDSIKALLKEHPEGLPMRVLVDTLEDQIISNAENKRRVLQNTVLQLKRAKAIKKVTKRGQALVMLN